MHGRPHLGKAVGYRCQHFVPWLYENIHRADAIAFEIAAYVIKNKHYILDFPDAAEKDRTRKSKLV